MERYRVITQGIWSNKMEWLPDVFDYRIVHATSTIDAGRRVSNAEPKTKIISASWWGPGTAGDVHSQHKIVWMLKQFRTFILYGDGSFIHAVESTAEREQYYEAARYVAGFGRCIAVTGYERFERCEATGMLGQCLAYHFPIK